MLTNYLSSRNSPSSASCFSASQGISRKICNPKFYCRLHKIPLRALTLSYMIPVHAYLISILILYSNLKWSHFFRLPYRNFYVFFSFPYVPVFKIKPTHLNTPGSLKSWTYVVCMGRDSSVGIAPRYGLDGPGIESRWGRGGEIFRTRPDRPWGPPSLLYNGYRVFPGGKAAGA